MIILDNMTLQGAARALDPDVGRQRSWEDRDRSRNKWDYDANEAIQVAVDLMCLSQLCHAVVFHDRISTVDDDFVGRWKTENCPLDNLAEIVAPVPIGREKAAALLEQALGDAVRTAATPEFNRYVDVLAREELTSTFLRISNGYFETGYSDPGIFEDLRPTHQYSERIPALRMEAERLLQEAVSLLSEPTATRHRLRNLLPAARTAMIAWDRKRHARLLNSHFENLMIADSRMRRYGSGGAANYPFARLGLPESDRFEAIEGAKDLVRNITAANYYGTIARDLRAQYLPHPLRAPFSIVASGGPPAQGGVSEETMVARMQFARTARATRINELVSTGNRFGGALYVDLAFPFALALVLEEARSPEDFVRQLLIIRDSKPARRMRRWFTRFGEELQSGSLTLGEIESRAGAFDRPIATWMEQAPGGDGPGPSPITIGINLGFLAVEKGVRFRRPNLALREFRLIQDMARISDASPRLGPALRRVFGDEVEQAWSLSQLLLRQSHEPDSPSILDRRTGY